MKLIDDCLEKNCKKKIPTHGSVDARISFGGGVVKLRKTTMRVKRGLLQVACPNPNAT